MFIEMLEVAGFKILINVVANRLTTIIVEKRVAGKASADCANLSFTLFIPAFRRVFKAEASVDYIAVWKWAIAIKKSEQD